MLPLLLAFLFLATYASLAPAALLADALKLIVTALAAALCATPVERPWASRPLGSRRRCSGRAREDGGCWASPRLC